MSKNQTQPAAQAGAPEAGKAPEPTAPAQPAAPKAAGLSMVCLEGFTHNEATFVKGQEVSAEELAKIDKEILQRRVQNGFLGFSA